MDGVKTNRLEVIPPTYDTVELYLNDLTSIVNKKLYCSDPADVPKKPLEYAGEVVEISSNKVAHLECLTDLHTEGIEHWKTVISLMQNSSFISEDYSLYTWLKGPPNYDHVRKWCNTRLRLNTLGSDVEGHDRKHTRIFKSLTDCKDTNEIEGVTAIQKCQDKNDETSMQGNLLCNKSRIKDHYGKELKSHRILHSNLTE